MKLPRIPWCAAEETQSVGQGANLSFICNPCWRTVLLRETCLPSTHLYQKNVAFFATTFVNHLRISHIIWHRSSFRIDNTRLMQWNIDPQKRETHIYCQTYIYQKRVTDSQSTHYYKYNRYKSKRKHSPKKNMLQALAKQVKEGKGYTFSPSAATKINVKKEILYDYTKNIQTGIAATEQPPTLGCSMETKVCMGNHETWIHALNRGCGAVPSIVTAVLWRNLVWLLVQPEWMTAQMVVSYIRHPATNHKRMKTQT